MPTHEYEAEIAALETKFAGKPGGNVVFYGSSSIRLWPRLQHDFSELSVENWGFGGSTLRDCADFFGRAMVPRKPRALVFYAGDNDLARGASPDDVWNAFISDAKVFSRRHAKIYFRVYFRCSRLGCLSCSRTSRRLMR